MIIVAMQVGELAGIAVGATVMLNILIAGYAPTHYSLVTPERIKDTSS